MDMDILKFCHQSPTPNFAKVSCSFSSEVTDTPNLCAKMPFMGQKISSLIILILTLIDLLCMYGLFGDLARVAVLHN